MQALFTLRSIFALRAFFLGLRRFLAFGRYWASPLLGFGVRWATALVGLRRLLTFGRCYLCIFLVNQAASRLGVISG